MRNALAIARKELSIYFTTPWAYIVFTAMVAITGFFFMGDLSVFKQVQEDARRYTWAAMGPGADDFKNLTDGVVLHLWGTMEILTLFIAPFLSMGLFARERRDGTLELLMTSPVRPIELVFGKYLAGVAVSFATFGLTIIFPLVLAAFGHSESGSALEWSTVLLGYGGMLLWGAMAIAVGMFVSTLTESEGLAWLLTLVALLPWMLLGIFAESAPEPLRSILNHLSIGFELQNLAKGVLDLNSLIFFASAIILALFLTHRSVEAQRWA